MELSADPVDQKDPTSESLKVIVEKISYFF